MAAPRINWSTLILFFLLLTWSFFSALVQHCDSGHVRHPLLVHFQSSLPLLEPVAILVLPVPLDGELLAVLVVCYVFGMVKEFSN